MHRSKLRPARLFGACAALILALAVSACAPGLDPDAGSGETGPETVNPEGGENPAPDYEPNTELPDGFPSDDFLFPEELTIVDVGERSAQQWYLVLRAQNADQTETAWAEIVDRNDFIVSDAGENVEGGPVASLTSRSLLVQAQAIPQQDGTVLLSYELLLRV